MNQEAYLREVALEPNAGTEKWANKIRKTARELSHESDRLFLELGKMLYLIWDTPTAGAGEEGPLYERWGYSTFADYCETELGIEKRRAQRLRDIWYTIEVQCKGISLDVKGELVALGSTRLRVLSRVLDANNAAAWATLARDLTVAEVRDVVRQYNEGVSLDSILTGEPSTEDSPEGVTEMEPPEPRYADADEPGDTPDENRYQTEVFRLAVPQVQTVQNTIDVVRRILGNPSAKKGHCLDLVCSDFLMNHSAADDPAEARKDLMSKLEKGSSIRVIAIDSSTGDVLYGMQTLEKLAHREID